MECRVHFVGAGLQTAWDDRDQRHVPGSDDHCKSRRPYRGCGEQPLAHRGSRHPLAWNKTDWDAMGGRNCGHIPVCHQPRGILHLQFHRRQGWDLLLPRPLRDAEGGGAVRVAHRERDGRGEGAVRLRRRAQHAAQRLVPRGRLRAGGRARAQGQALPVDRRASDAADQRKGTVRLHAGRRGRVPEGNTSRRHDMRPEGWREGGGAVRQELHQGNDAGEGEVRQEKVVVRMVVGGEEEGGVQGGMRHGGSEGEYGVRGRKGRELRDDHEERVRALLQGDAVRASGVQCGAGEDVQAQDRQHHVALCSQRAGPRAQDDSGGGRRKLRGSVRRGQRRPLLRRQLLRAPDDGPEAASLLDLRGREGAATQDAAGSGHPELHQQRYGQLAERHASGDTGLGRRDTRQKLHLQHKSRTWRSEAAGAGADGRSDRDAQHAGRVGKRAGEVGHQPRLADAADHSVPRRVLRPRGARRVRHRRGAARIQPQLQHHEAAGGQDADDGERPGVPVQARRGRGRGDPERQHAQGEHKRGAPVAPARARLLGARLRRGALQPHGPRRGARQGGEPAAAEHGGGVPARVDGDPVRGGQPGHVGVPLPHRAAPPHGHGRHLRRRGGEAARAQGGDAQGGHDVRTAQ